MTDKHTRRALAAERLRRESARRAESKALVRAYGDGARDAQARQGRDVSFRLPQGFIDMVAAEFARAFAQQAVRDNQDKNRVVQAILLGVAEDVARDFNDHGSLKRARAEALYRMNDHRDLVIEARLEQPRVAYRATLDELQDWRVR